MFQSQSLSQSLPGPVFAFARGLWLRSFALVITACTTMLTGGCGSHAEETVLQASGENWPKVLRIAYTPSTENPEGQLRIYDDLTRYLSTELGIEVDLVKTTSYGPKIEAMRAHKIDVGTGSPMTYLIAHQRADAIPMFVPGNPDGTQGTYSSLIVTSRETGIRSIDELIARASTSTFAFVDPPSSSGHLVPRAYLEGRGVIPEEAFKQVVFTQSHLNSVMTVAAAKVEAAAIARATYERFIEKERIGKDELRVLWESAPIPSVFWFMRGDLPAGLRARFTQAFLDMPKRAPEVLAGFRTSMRKPDMVFVPIDDADVQPFRELALNLKNITLLQTE